MNNTTEKIIAGTLAFGTVSFTTYKFVELHRKKRAADAIDSLADHIHLDLEDPYIKEYIEKAVYQEVHRAAGDAANSIVNLHKADISSAVSKEVAAQKDILAGSVKSAIAKKVGELNIEDIKNDALSEAKEMASDKLKEDMDDILDNYKQGLDNLATIYKAISEKTIANATKNFPGLTFDVKL